MLLIGLRFLPIGLVLFAVSIPDHARANESVVVMPLKSKAVKENTLAALDELVVHSMTQLSRLNVVTKQDIEAQLDREALRDLLACDGVKCAAEIGGALGARYLLAGSVRKLGSKIIVSLSLIDTTTQGTKRGQSRVRNNEDLYERAIDEAVRRTLGLAVATAAAGSSSQQNAATPTGIPSAISQVVP